MARDPLKALSDKTHNKAIQQEESTEDDLQLFLHINLESFPHRIEAHHVQNSSLLHVILNWKCYPTSHTCGNKHMEDLASHRPLSTPLIVLQDSAHQEAGALDGNPWELAKWPGDGEAVGHPDPEEEQVVEGSVQVGH